MITWGIVGNSHDASIAVFETKQQGLGPSKGSAKLLWAGLAKDFSKIPNDPHLNKKLIRRAMRHGKPNKVIWYERPFLKTLRQYWAGQGWLGKENDIRAYLRQWDINCKIEYTQHHLSHAAYAYYTQPQDDCAVICLDSIGEFETLTVWHGKDNKLKKIHSQGYPHSLGLFYSAMTQRVGLVPQRDEYMIASMGDNGDPHKLFSIILDELVHTHGMGYNPKVHMVENMHRGCNWWRPELNSKQDLNDIAAATQKVFEHCVNNIGAWTMKQTGCTHLALAGGGAMNRRAVDNLKNRWDTVHVPKNPGDPGSCIGAVLAKTKTKVTLDKQWHR